MSKHCQQDGGFIGDAGCTHPNHQHSELVKGLLASKPHDISPRDADAALAEGFYVNSAFNTRVGFGKQLATHIDHHGYRDRIRRKANLLYAVATVKGGKRGPNPKGGPGSFAYAREIDGRKFLVLTDEHGNVEDVFRRHTGGKEMRLMRGQPHERKPSVCALSDNLRPEPGAWMSAHPTGISRFERRTANRFDNAKYTTTGSRRARG